MKDSSRSVFRDNEWRGLFVLNVTAPSGRRPWPVQTNSRRDDYITGQPIEVAFSYPVRFIPAGKKTPVVARVMDRAAILPRTTDPGRTEPVCTIRSATAGGDAREVVHYDRELWWSLPGSLTIQRFAAALNEGEHAAVGLLDRKSVSATRPFASLADLNIRKTLHDGRDERIGHLQRGSHDILVSGDRVFLREGAPAYTLWNGYRNGSITGVGTSEVVIELASSRRNPAFEDASNELIFGRVFEASDRQQALDFVASKRLDLEEDAAMEVLRPELLQQDAQKIQLEAILEKLLRMVAIFRAGTKDGSDQILAELGRLFEILTHDASAVQRADDLKQFFNWVMSEPQAWKKTFLVERLFVHDAIDRIEAECARRGISSPFAKAALDQEDDAALARLSFASY
jgi:hypothetical protein